MTERSKGNSSHRTNWSDLVQATYNDRTDEVHTEGLFGKTFVRSWYTRTNTTEKACSVHVLSREPSGVLARLGWRKPTLDVTAQETHYADEVFAASTRTYHLSLVGGSILTFNAFYAEFQPQPASEVMTVDFDREAEMARAADILTRAV